MGKYDFDLELVYQNSLLLILEQIAPHSVVLEFGPANGRLTRYLKEELYCQVYLVELDASAGKQALEYGEDLVIGDIEQYEWLDRYRCIKFDYLIFADVLEHLHSPQDVLIQSKLLLKEDGSILLSVPNVAHNAVLINLLNHNFHYSDVGLLDNTHIHMFTKNSLEQMLESSGLYPLKKMATYVETEHTEIPAFLTGAEGIDAEYWTNRPYGEVYQYVYEVKKEKALCIESQNYLVKTSSSACLQVFWDTGSGYYEDHSKKIRITQPKGIQEFYFDCPDHCCEIRMDPMERDGLIKLINCCAETEQESIPLIPKSHNAKICQGRLYLFESMDPQMIFSLPESTRHVSITIQYMGAIHIDLWDSLFSEINGILLPYQKTIEEKKEDNIRFEQRIEELQFEKNMLLQEVDQYHQKCEEMQHTLHEIQDSNREYSEKLSQQTQAWQISQTEHTRLLEENYKLKDTSAGLEIQLADLGKKLEQITKEKLHMDEVYQEKIADQLLMIQKLRNDGCTISGTNTVTNEDKESGQHG